jgi:hypothetical protein
VTLKREDKMAQAKTTEQRALAHIGNKIDEVAVRVEAMQEALDKFRRQPRQPVVKLAPADVSHS